MKPNTYEHFIANITKKINNTNAIKPINIGLSAHIEADTSETNPYKHFHAQILKKTTAGQKNNLLNIYVRIPKANLTKHEDQSYSAPAHVLYKAIGDALTKTDPTYPKSNNEYTIENGLRNSKINQNNEFTKMTITNEIKKNMKEGRPPQATSHKTEAAKPENRQIFSQQKQQNHTPPQQHSKIIHQ